MAIFDEKKMEQKPIYPTKKTPSYADWALFNMGKELEESIEGGGGEITVDQEVIAESTNPVAGGAVKTYVDTEVGNVNEVPDSTAADVNKILTVDANGEPNWSTPLTPQVTVDQTVIADSTNPVAGGGVKTYVDTEIAGVNEVPVSTSSDEDKILIVNNQGTPQWGYIEDITDELPGSTSLDAGKVLTVNSSGNAEWQTPSGVTVDQTVIAGSTNPVAGGGVKTYVDTEIAGVNEVPSSTSSDEDKILIVNNQGTPEWGYVEDITDTLPGSVVADAGKVLTVNSSGNAEWQTPISSSVIPHTYNTFGELATAIINNPTAILYYAGNFGTIGVCNYTIDGTTGVRIGLCHPMIDASLTYPNIRLLKINCNITNTDTSISANNTTITSSGTASTGSSTLFINSFYLYY